MPKGRFIKNATPEQKLQSLRERLELFSEHIPFTGCTIYMGFIHREGYGLITFNHQSVLAHRASYMANVGPIPDGCVVMHTCDVKCCINPAHLRLGTQADNMRDMLRKGRSRYVKGEQTWAAKLSSENIREIRSSTERSAVLADRFGVSARSIRDVRLHKTWKHVA
jgi:hypothetical protein